MKRTTNTKGRNYLLVVCLLCLLFIASKAVNTINDLGISIANQNHQIQETLISVGLE